MSPNNRFVITGGPGAGKTTLIEAMQQAGYRCLPEAGRSIILANRSIGGPAGHDLDRRLYAELMLSWDMRSHAEAAQHAGAVFYDRGIPDLIGYLRLIGKRVPAHFVRAAQDFTYADPIFLAPAWEKIFVTDGERAQDFVEAQATEEAIRSAYLEQGYMIVELPKTDVVSRVGYLRATIESHRVEPKAGTCTRKD